MTKNNCMRFGYFFICVFFLSSCLSAPDKEYTETSQYRDKIIKYNLKKYAEDDFTKAEANYAEAKSLMEKKNYYKARKVIAVTNQGYKAILDKAFPLSAKEYDTSTLNEKNNAETIKAQVAVKNEFDEAEKTYTEAKDKSANKDYEDAIDLYISAQEKYKNAYFLAREKKVKADDAIKKSENSQADLEIKANEFEKTINDIKQELNQNEME